MAKNQTVGSGKDFLRVFRDSLLVSVAPSLIDTNETLLGPVSPFLYPGTYTIRNVGSACRSFASVSADTTDNSITTGCVLAFAQLARAGLCKSKLLLQLLRQTSAPVFC